MTTSTPAKTRLLLVDDEPAVTAALHRALRRRFGDRLVIVIDNDPHAALARARTQRLDIVLSDLRMPLLDGVTLLTLISAMQPHCVRMLLTATADFETAQRAINDAGLFRYLTKPWSDTELAAHFDTALLETEQRLQRELPPEEAERRRLEMLEPGLTHVDWGPNGEVLMPPLPNSGPLPH
jgi:response regulator RpfG family c-di-GMP phosphodiesterase